MSKEHNLREVEIVVSVAVAFVSELQSLIHSNKGEYTNLFMRDK